MRSIAAHRRAEEELDKAEAEDPTGPKGLLVDNLGHCSLTVAAVAFLACFLGAVIAGVMGPPIFSTASNPGASLNAACTGGNTGSCNVTWTGTLTDMSPYHQVMWLDMTMARPLNGDGSPAGANFPASWNMLYVIDLYAVQSDGTLVVLTQGAQHVAPMAFGAADLQSANALLFATSVRGAAGARGGRVPPSPPTHTPTPRPPARPRRPPPPPAPAPAPTARRRSATPSSASRCAFRTRWGPLACCPPSTTTSR